MELLRNILLIGLLGKILLKAREIQSQIRSNGKRNSSQNILDQFIQVLKNNNRLKRIESAKILILTKSFYGHIWLQENYLK